MAKKVYERRSLGNSWTVGELMDLLSEYPRDYAVYGDGDYPGLTVEWQRDETKEERKKRLANEREIKRQFEEVKKEWEAWLKSAGTT